MFGATGFCFKCRDRIGDVLSGNIILICEQCSSPFCKNCCSHMSDFGFLCDICYYEKFIKLGKQTGSSSKSILSKMTSSLRSPAGVASDRIACLNRGKSEKEKQKVREEEELQRALLFLSKTNNQEQIYKSFLLKSVSVPGTNSQFQQNRDEGCDVIIQIGKRSFKASRQVLMTKVKFFDSMFTLDMKEKRESIVKLEPEIIDPDVFNEILDFIYFSKFNLSVDKMEAFYRAVDFLCFDELLDTIVKFMDSDLNIDDITTYMNITITYNLKTLEDNCKQWILSNPKDLYKGLVPYLSFDQLVKLLESAEKESLYERMFCYSIEWIQEDEEERKEKLVVLLSIVKFDRLPAKFVSKVVAKNELIYNDLGALQLVVDTLLMKQPISNN